MPELSRTPLCPMYLLGFHTIIGSTTTYHDATRIVKAPILQQNQSFPPQYGQGQANFDLCARVQ
jgi:hypothetical protein